MTARKRKHYEFEDTSQDGSESCAFQDPQSSIFKSQAAHQLCTRCASIDFNTVLPKEGWVRIRSIGMLADFVQEPECSVCQLFGSKARLIATNLVSGLKSYSERIYINYSLYAFSSFAIFGTNRPPPRGLSETKLFAILGEYGFGVDKSPHEPTISSTKSTSIFHSRLSRIDEIQYDLGNGYHFDMKLTQCAGFLAPMPDSLPSQNSEQSFTGRILNPESIDISTVKKWLAFCQGHHRTSCGLRSQKTLCGLKVIHCKSQTIVPAPLHCNYVALNYVWGRPATEMQHSSANDAFDLRASSFPNVVKDAIEISQKLGFNYLWVDRYCIDQHNAEEKHSQIRNMDSIYNTAELTLIAAVGNNPLFGLPGVSSQRPRIPQKFFHLGGIEYVSIPPDPKWLIELSSWSQRAWTYQEGLLSTRRLIFTEYQTYFECRQIHCLESVNSPVEILHTKKRFKLLEWNSSGLFPQLGVGQVGSDVWDRIREYTARHLTYEEDILNGMLGIFKTFERMRVPVRHHFGIPFVTVIRGESWVIRDIVNLCSSTSDQFIHGLCWTLFKPGQRRANLERFPSWSWIGWVGRATQSLPHSAFRDTFKIKIAIELKDGTSLPVEKFFSSVYNKLRPSTLSPYLQVEVETIEFSVQHVISEFEVLRLTPGWWAKIVLTQDHVLYARFLWTLQIEDSGDLANRLSERECCGIFLGGLRKVFSRNQAGADYPFILVVDKAVPITERIDPKRWMNGFSNGKLRQVAYWLLERKGVQISTKRQSFRLR
jgi:Heterokaryon incompatibility protein (HET)